MASDTDIDASPEAAAFYSALDDFSRATRHARMRFQPDTGLSLPQFHLVEPLLAAEGPLPVGELASAAGVSAPTATRMLDCLERDGLVERARRRDDRRVVLVTLTAGGARAARAQRERHEAHRRALFESLTPAERRGAARLLERLAAAIEGLR
jgi:MarR family transcriptional regulator, organic hydroperoxide resistance regulator